MFKIQEELSNSGVRKQARYTIGQGQEYSDREGVSGKHVLP